MLVNIVAVTVHDERRIKASINARSDPVIAASKSTSSKLEVEQIGVSVAPEDHVLFPFRVHKTRQVTL